MTTLFIANVRADYPDSVRTRADLVKGTADGSDTTSRFLWHASAGDIIVLPEIVDPRYVSYVEETLALPHHTLHVVEVNELLTDDVLLRPRMLETLKHSIDRNNVLRVQPFVQTRGTVALASALGAVAEPGLHFAHENGVDMLNSKATFRKLAAGVGVPIAQGCAVRSKRELCTELIRLQKLDRPLIAKHDHAGGGHGNLILSTENAVRSEFPGAREFISLGRPVEELANLLWSELTDSSYSTVTLEVYEEAIARFYLEYDLGDQAPRLVSTGSIRYGEPSAEIPPQWIGLDIPFGLGATDGTNAVSQGQLIVSAVHALGYKGMLNVDGIVTPVGEPVFQEINARWGGGLVYDVIGRRLVGASYSRSHLLRSLLDTPKADFAVLHDRLIAADVHYSHERGSGALILGTRSDLADGSEILLITATENDMDELESAVRSALA
ncbi:hypothetical protein [Rathayibacter iranicus]|uniref:ATP-grasp domain-containing protein n=1 Tax=Rathayibacter iranicus NCPPB 2253 = VKM Ac-1602 TaxID=1328868 RepID=A0ABX5LCC0_9MICO|nr:hypothetical protein [Rathayibacter iranicus]MWV31177.1 hypothetical protein [Rathayibacter iranicus NCPPB 2253 = VKM Ac-1602]PWJ64017.1 hypothetical protein B0H03_106145 [Rathayibacter iranicus NCPPB 2253 = VKM Ac-1602]